MTPRAFSYSGLPIRTAGPPDETRLTSPAEKQGPPMKADLSLLPSGVSGVLGPLDLHFTGVVRDEERGPIRCFEFFDYKTTGNVTVRPDVLTPERLRLEVIAMRAKFEAAKPRTAPMSILP